MSGPAVLLLLLCALPASAGEPFAATRAELDRTESRLSKEHEALMELRQRLAAHKAAHPSACLEAEALRERRELLTALREKTDSFSDLVGIYDSARDDYAMASLAMAGFATRDKRTQASSFREAPSLHLRMGFGDEMRAFRSQTREEVQAEEKACEEALLACRRTRLLRWGAGAAALFFVLGLAAAWFLLAKPVPAGR